MENMKELASRRPVIFIMICLALAIMVTELPLKNVLLPYFSDQTADYLSGIILQFGCGALLLVVIARLGLLRSAGFRSPQPWKDLWLVWPLAAITLVNFLPLLDGSLAIDTAHPLRLGLYGLLSLSIGFFEEILGRSLMLVVLLRAWGSTKRGLYAAVLVSSLLFGAGHIINLIENRFALAANLAQIGYGFFFAVAFAACFLRLRSIWPVLLLHAAFDFGGGLREIALGAAWPQPVYTNTPQEALVSLLITLPLLLYGLFILRKEFNHEKHETCNSQAEHYHPLCTIWVGAKQTAPGRSERKSPLCRQLRPKDYCANRVSPSNDGYDQGEAGRRTGESIRIRAIRPASPLRRFSTRNKQWSCQSSA